MRALLAAWVAVITISSVQGYVKAFSKQWKYIPMLLYHFSSKPLCFGDVCFSETSYTVKCDLDPRDPSGPCRVVRLSEANLETLQGIFPETYFSQGLSIKSLSLGERKKERRRRVKRSALRTPNWYGAQYGQELLSPNGRQGSYAHRGRQFRVATGFPQAQAGIGHHRVPGIFSQSFSSPGTIH